MDTRNLRERPKVSYKVPDLRKVSKIATLKPKPLTSNQPIKVTSRVVKTNSNPTLATVKPIVHHSQLLRLFQRQILIQLLKQEFQAQTQHLRLRDFRQYLALVLFQRDYQLELLSSASLVRNNNR